MSSSNRKRVLFWSERFWPTIGGIGRSAAHLLPALTARGYEFTVLTLKENADLPEEDQFEGIRVCRWPLWTAIQGRDVMQLFDMRQRIAQLKRDFAPDLVHIGFLGPTLLFHTQTIRMHAAPVLVSMDSAFWGQEAGEASLAREILLAADWVTSVSLDRLAKMRAALPELAPRSSCVYNGTPIPETAPDVVPDDPPMILCLGRLNRVKGFDLAIEAMVEINRHKAEVRMTIAGDGPERPHLAGRIQDLDLEDVIDMPGKIEPEDVYDLIGRATVVLMPSRDEGIPSVAREAGLCCRPVVGTRVGGMPEVIDHGRTGLLVEPENSQALARAVLRLLADPEKAAVMGRKARDMIGSAFGFETYVDAYDALYRKLMP